MAYRLWHIARALCPGDVPFAIGDMRHTIMATSIDLIPSQRKLVHGWLLYAITAGGVGGAGWRVGWLGMAASLLGAVVVSIPIVTFQGEAVMNDYVPLLDTPLFFIGFVIFLAGIGITAANYLVGVARRE